METLRHEIALIVGAGPGLSASLARLFSREGMRVVVAARNTGKLATLSAETGAQTFACDAVDPDQVARLFDEVEGRIGAPGVVVYNASGRLRGDRLDQRAAQPPTGVIDNNVWSANSAFHLVEQACHLIGLDGVTGEGL